MGKKGGSGKRDNLKSKKERATLQLVNNYACPKTTPLSETGEEMGDRKPTSSPAISKKTVGGKEGKVGRGETGEKKKKRSPVGEKRESGQGRISSGG